MTRTRLNALRIDLWTLGLGFLGGALALWAGLPLPWMIGSMLMVAGAAIAGQQLDLSPPLVAVAFILLGIQAGAGVTPEALALVGKWPLSLLGLAIAVPVISWAGSRLLIWRGWDRESALLAAVPGALSVILAIANERGADTSRVAIVQTIRVVFLILLLPMVVAVPPVQAVATSPSWAELAIVVSICAIAGFLAARFKLPGGWVVGAMIASAIIHGGGFSRAVLPPFLANCAVVALGALVGRRFVGQPPGVLLNTAVIGLALFCLTTVMAVAAAAATAWVTGIGLGQTMLAFAPGALEAMLIMATLMHLDPAYVGVHHVARFLGISLILPVVMRWRKNHVEYRRD